MISAILTRISILILGFIYPAYSSYKAVRTKNVKEYVKWMMYWIVFALFTCIETITDIFLSWFPFYYEVKIIIVIWLLSPATKGSSTLYRKFVHPTLTRREQEIDEYINQAKEKGYTAVLQLGSKGVNYATNVIMQTALKTIQNTTLRVQGDNNYSNDGRMKSSQSDYYIYGHIRTDNTLSHNSNEDQDHTDAMTILRSRSIDSYYDATRPTNILSCYEGSNIDDNDLNHPPSLLPSTQINYNSNDNEQDEIICNDENINLIDLDGGAARIRDLPKRKYKSNKNNNNENKKNKYHSKIAVRGRKKIRYDESDDIIDVE